MRHPHARALACAALAIATLALAAPTLASELDESTGRLSLSDAAFGYGFDAPPDPAAPIVLFSFDDEGYPIDDLDTRFFDAPDGLEGPGALSLGGRVDDLLVDLRGLDASLGHRRVELRMWLRPQGTSAQASLLWYTGDADVVFAGPDEDARAARLMSAIPLMPTGRATDDGWRELTSGPIDLRLGGHIPLTSLLVRDTTPSSTGRLDIPLGDDPLVRVFLDALEVIDLGPAAVPQTPCALPDAAAACGPQGVCMFGACVDAAQALGPIPPPAVLDDYLERRILEVEVFDGVRVAREADFPGQLRALASDPAPDFWLRLRKAYESLLDGHSSPPVAALAYNIGTGVCIHLSEADLLPDAPLAPMIFRANDATSLGAAVLPGDVLVALDGLPVADWMALAEPYVFENGDPRGRLVQTTPDVLHLAARFGAQVELARCSNPDGCSPDTLTPITINMAQVAAPLWQGQTLGVDDYESMGCDFRFLRPVQDPHAQSYAFAGHADDDQGVRSILINGVPGYSSWSQPWYAALDVAFNGERDLLLLDQRLGQGGTFQGVLALTSPLLAPDRQESFELLPHLEGLVDPDLLDRLRACEASNLSFYGTACADYTSYPIVNTRDANLGRASDARLAVLLGLDVSGNDYLTYALRFRSGPTRVFGPGPTQGAYGASCGMPAYLGEYQSANLQCSDTLVRGPNLPIIGLSYLSGVGEMPHQIVYQRQSDAIAGRDTLIETARQWLLQETTP